MFARDGLVVVADWVLLDAPPPQAESTKSNSIAGKSLKSLCTLASFSSSSLPAENTSSSVRLIRGSHVLMNHGVVPPPGRPQGSPLPYTTFGDRYVHSRVGLAPAPRADDFLLAPSFPGTPGSLTQCIVWHRQTQQPTPLALENSALAPA